MEVRVTEKVYGRTLISLPWVPKSVSRNAWWVHPAGLPNSRVNVPHARRQRGRTRFTYLDVPLLSSRAPGRKWLNGNTGMRALSTFMAVMPAMAGYQS